MKTEHFSENGFDFEVDKVPSYFVHPQTGEPTFSGGYTIYGQNFQPLANVGGQYHLFNNEQFVNLAGEISQLAGLEISHFTSINNGANVLVAFKSGDTNFQIDGKTFGQTNHLILMDNRKGTLPFQVGDNARLHRCDNMFSSTKVVKRINHNSQMPILMQALMAQIELQFQANQQFIDWQIRMASIEVSPQIIKEAKEQLFNIGDRTISTTMANKLLRFDNCLQTEMAELGQNAWALFNGVTRLTTHELKLDKFFAEKDYPLFGERQKLNSGIVNFLNEKFN